MPRMRMAPPPQQATRADLYRFLLGCLMIPLGLAILIRTLSAGIVTPAAILMGLAFVAFGSYRVYTAVVRYRMFRAARKS